MALETDLNQKWEKRMKLQSINCTPLKVEEQQEPIKEATRGQNRNNIMLHWD